jgi:hypothetical protein
MGDLLIEAGYVLNAECRQNALSFACRLQQIGTVKHAHAHARTHARHKSLRLSVIVKILRASDKNGAMNL